ncbi:MAG TPA: UbiD family decarboxylase [Nitrososphaerales archaeon]|nr:UbiD family decarboxylase [Nitrososphaerales archaeon]
MSRDLRTYLEQLEESGLLLNVEDRVDPKYELSAIVKSAEKAGKAILFHRVGESEFRVVANLVISRKMLALALGTSEEATVPEYIKRTENMIKPRIVEMGPVKEVILKGELANSKILPVVTHAIGDVGPYITAGMAVAKDPENGFTNMSFNRMQLKGPTKFGIRMMAPQHLGVIQSKVEKADRNLEVAIVIGAHPFEMIAASTTLPYGADHFELAGALDGKPVDLVKCETIDVNVPANAEIILEGEVLANLREEEGPYGDVFQFYIPQSKNHVFHLKAISHRRQPIYHTIQAGSREDIHLLALSREAHIQRALSLAGYQVRNVCTIPSLLSAAISIKKRFEGEPKNASMCAFGAYSWLKYCVVVDEDVNVFDLSDVWWALSTRSRPDKGIFIVPEALGFPRDLHHLHQSKIGIDATAPLDAPEEKLRKYIPGEEKVDLSKYSKENKQ